MEITLITLFPDIFENFKKFSIVKNAIDKNILKIKILNLRNFSLDNKVDDYLFGGGSGMLLKIDPIVKALNSIKEKDQKIILLSPTGKLFTQKISFNFANEKKLVFICGHYEGIDSRILKYVDEVISIGNFIVTGGEVPAMLITESIIRLIPKVINNKSLDNETFSKKNNLLEEDQFTKPVIFENQSVPEVLLSGNHLEIKKWRQKSSLKKTIGVLLNMYK